MKSLTKLFSLLLVLTIGLSFISCSSENDAELEELVFDPNNQEIPKVAFVTNFGKREDFRFYVKHTSEIQVDWGNGQKQVYPANNQNFSLLVGTVVDGIVKIYSKNSDAITSIDINFKKVKTIDFKNAIELNEVLLNGNQITQINFGTNPKLKTVNISENELNVLDLDAALSTLHKNNTAENPGTIILGDGYDGNQKPSTEIVNILKQNFWIVNQN